MGRARGCQVPSAVNSGKIATRDSSRLPVGTPSTNLPPVSTFPVSQDKASELAHRMAALGVQESDLDSGHAY